MRRLTVFAVLFLTLVALILVLVVSGAPAGEGPELGYDFVLVRAYYDQPAMLAEAAAWQEPWEVNQEEGFAIFEATPTEYEWLESLGFRLMVDLKLTDKYNRAAEMLPGQQDGIPGYPCYRTVEETFTTAEAIALQYPQLATWIDAGDSWEKTAPGGLPGYDMLVLRLTNSATPGPKPKLFLMTAVHAREYTTAELNTRFAEFLVQNYGADPDVTWLLDNQEVHLMFQSNPDGRKHAEAGELWRKNTNENYCAPTSSNRGADLNRNFEFQWGCCGGSSSSQCSTTYRGPSPASEPETQAIQNYVRAEFPDQREPDLNAAAPVTATGVFLDIHSSGNLVLWPWGFQDIPPAPNNIALQTLGRKFAFFNNYQPQQAIDLYLTDGTTDDFAYGDLGLAAYTFELGTTFFQDCQYFENVILPENMPALVYAAKASRTPYLTPAGPDTLDLVLSEATVEPGTLVTVTATMNDTRYNHNYGGEPVQNVVAAEVYIDVPPWVTATLPISVPMSAADGNFNSPIETVVGTVDTSGLTNGRHTLFARGKDALDNWGAISSAFLFVIDPAVAPVIEGQVTAADTGQPLAATVRAGAHFAAQTDPSTGHYQMYVISGTYDLTADPDLDIYASSTITGVVAQDLQTVEQDFSLYPYCTVLSDDVESGNAGWTADPPWAITTESSHSPSHSWTDSPGGDYGSNQEISLTSPPLDLSDYEGVALDYWQICDTESGYDYCFVEISTDGGASWTKVASFDGPDTGWDQVALELPELNGAPDARVRFLLDSDFSMTEDGWHIDDINLAGAGPECVLETEPAASFESSTPDPLGSTTVFTNTSTGGGLSYEWDFGDGSPVSTLMNPSHLYTFTGTFTVTLTVTNSIGTDVATDQVEIFEPEGVPPIFWPLIQNGISVEVLKP